MTEENLLLSDIPEKFKDPESGALKADALLKSYIELERKMSQRPNAPKSHNDYCIDCSHGMFEPDEELNRRMHEKGFSQEQAQEVYNMASDKMVPMLQAMAADFQADREVEKLIEHFGGTEQWRVVSRQLLAYGQKNLPADILDSLTSSYEGVLALHRMMKGQEPSLNRQNGMQSSSMDEMELNSMMRDPKYWRDKDPAFVAKVTEGFKSLYGN
ncbi:MAG: hypothetical protein GC137_06705 [Alphaproteobacteria bacterium]|nr:hypothetical protein [Alphaproteobacteria bacterium]